MRIEVGEIAVHVYHHDAAAEAKLNEVLALLRGIKHQGEKIMADTQATLAKLADANSKIDALGLALDGVQGDITALKALIAGGATPDEVAAAVDAMSTNLDGKLAKAQDIDSQTP